MVNGFFRWLNDRIWNELIDEVFSECVLVEDKFRFSPPRPIQRSSLHYFLEEQRVAMRSGPLLTGLSTILFHVEQFLVPVPRGTL